MFNKSKHSVWQTIEVGNGLKTAYKFHTACNKLDMKVQCFADDLMQTKEFRQSIATTKKDLDLIFITPREIGLKKDVPFGRFLEEIPNAGFEICPAEVGPQLRIQYQGKEWVNIAMIPIMTTIYSGAAWDDDDEPLSVWELSFGLCMTGGNDTILQPSRPELTTSCGGLKNLVRRDTRFVVIKPRS